MAFAKSQLAANSALPLSGTIFICVADRDKQDVIPIARSLAEMGYQLLSTRGTAKALRAAGIAVEECPKLQEGRPNLIDYMKNSADRPGHQHAERQGGAHRRGQDPRRRGDAPA